MNTCHFALRLKSLLLGSGIVVIGSHAALSATPSVGGFEVTLPAQMPDPAATVVVLNLQEP